MKAIADSKAGVLRVEIPLTAGKISGSGKNRVVAYERATADGQIDGLPVTVQVTAYVPSV